MAPRHSQAPQLPTLQFKEPLNWKAGKPIAVATLMKRLKTLYNELKDFEQEMVDVDSIRQAAKELCNIQLLGHKDRGVKAYTACCLSEILRLFAPDAPYTATNLKVCASGARGCAVRLTSVGNL